MPGAARGGLLVAALVALLGGCNSMAADTRQAADARDGDTVDTSIEATRGAAPTSCGSRARPTTSI